MKLNPIPRRKADKPDVLVHKSIPGVTNFDPKDMSGFSSTWKTTIGISFAVIAICSIFGIYFLSKFILDYLQQSGAPEWMGYNIPMWILSVVAVLLLFGGLRYITMMLADIVRFVFRIAQSDIITIAIAIVINALLLTLNGWIVWNIIRFIEWTAVDSFFTFNNWLSVIVLFMMLSGALIWIPRVGVYGENQLGQFDGNDNR